MRAALQGADGAACRFGAGLPIPRRGRGAALESGGTSLDKAIGALALSLHPSSLSSGKPSENPSFPSKRRLLSSLLSLLVVPARSSTPEQAPVRGLRDGTVELEVVLAVVADLQVEPDGESHYRASFVLEGHLPATQLSAGGVTVVPLESLRISDLSVSPHVVERLGRWEDREAGVTGRVHFDRRAIDQYRGCGPLRTLSLADEHGDEIVLRRASDTSERY